MRKNAVNYFLGCSSPEGFTSFFSELYSFDGGRRPYILKGGAGTGKSTLMKKLALELEKRGFEVHRVHCSSDPQSLDAVICRELNFCIADGTSPHVIEPVYPGAVETLINLGDCWDGKALFSKSKEIIEKTKLNSMCHARCQRFLSAAGKVRYDTQKICEEAILEYKIHAYADRFSKRRFKKKEKPCGSEKRIFISALTPDGTVFYGDTVKALAKEIILVDDKTSLASGMLFEELKNLAIRNGYEVISCFCPLSPSGYPEHIIIPELSIAFIRKHDEYPEFVGSRTIHSERFLDAGIISKRKNRIAFNNRIQSELVAEAVLSLREAKRIHDEIEKIYTPAMDFSDFDKIEKRILSEIL